jgi:hypothetical protein
MGLHRDRLAVKQEDGEAMLADFADGCARARARPTSGEPPSPLLARLPRPLLHRYIAVVYLSTGGTLVLEPDAAPGEGDAAWVPTPLARREIAVTAGRLVAWPNYAYKHGAGLAGGDDARWILGPVALLPGRARLAQSGDCNAYTYGKADDDNELHKLCGGRGVLDLDYPPLPPRGKRPVMSEKPTVEAIRALGSEDRLKELAAEKNSLDMLPLHMLCAHPDVTAESVQFVAALSPAAAAAVPVGKDGGAIFTLAAFNGAWSELFKLALHILCQNSNVTKELVEAVFALYPAAVFAKATFSPNRGDAAAVPLRGRGLSGDFTPRSLLQSLAKEGLSRRFHADSFAQLEERAKTPEAQAKTAEIEKQLKAARVYWVEREVETMFGPDGGETFKEGRFKSPVTVTDAHLPFLVPRLRAAIEIELSTAVTDISTICVGCPELTSLKMYVARLAPPCAFRPRTKSRAPRSCLLSHRTATDKSRRPS